MTRQIIHLTSSDYAAGERVRVEYAYVPSAPWWDGDPEQQCTVGYPLSATYQVGMFANTTGIRKVNLYIDVQVNCHFFGSTGFGWNLVWRWTPLPTQDGNPTTGNSDELLSSHESGRDIGGGYRAYWTFDDVTTQSALLPTNNGYNRRIIIGSAAANLNAVDELWNAYWPRLTESLDVVGMEIAVSGHPDGWTWAGSGTPTEIIGLSGGTGCKFWLGRPIAANTTFDPTATKVPYGPFPFMGA